MPVLPLTLADAEQTTNQQDNCGEIWDACAKIHSSDPDTGNGMHADQDRALLWTHTEHPRR